jgi:hypothetical protein
MDSGLCEPEQSESRGLPSSRDRARIRHGVQTGGMMFRKSIGARLARFRQFDTDKPHQHHDALEFSNGAIVLVTNRATGDGTSIACKPDQGKASGVPTCSSADCRRLRPPPVGLERRLSPGPASPMGGECPAFGSKHSNRTSWSRSAPKHQFPTRSRYDPRPG